MGFKNNVWGCGLESLCSANNTCEHSRV